MKVKYGDTDAEVDYLCIAGGRAPDTEALNLGEAGVEIEDNRKIKVDDTSARRTPRSTRSATSWARRLSRTRLPRRASWRSELAAGVETHPVDQSLVAGATFCQPQVASVGMTEAQAKDAGHDVKIGRLKLGAVGASPIYDDRDGR